MADHEVTGMLVDTGMEHTSRWYRTAMYLAVFTIVYNLAEGMVATWIGYEDESFTLFGFGVDSFIELISGLGIAHMVVRMQRHPELKRDTFERTAVRITGVAFYLLVAGLVVTSAYTVITHHRPETTWWGMVISGISIIVMLLLLSAKTRVGKKLNSEAILADAQCTRVCIYMSGVLLLSSAFYSLTRIGYIDAFGTLALAWFSWREGKECFEKARHDTFCSCDH